MCHFGKETSLARMLILIFLPLEGVGTSGSALLDFSNIFLIFGTMKLLGSVFLGGWSDLLEVSDPKPSSDNDDGDNTGRTNTSSTFLTKEVTEEAAGEATWREDLGWSVEIWMGMILTFSLGFSSSACLVWWRLK